MDFRPRHPVSKGLERPGPRGLGRGDGAHFCSISSVSRSTSFSSWPFTAAAAALILLAAAPVAAYTSAVYRFTGGPEEYREHRIDLSQNFPGNFFIEGGLDAYASAVSTGTFRRFTGRGGWEGEAGSLSFFASAVPKVDAYQARGFGADLSLRAARGMTDSDRYWWLDLDLGMARTVHEDGIELLAERMHRGGKTARLVPLSLTQTDLSAGVRARLESLTVSASATGSLYDKNLDNRRIRSLRNSASAESVSALEGYPRRSLFGKVTYEFVMPVRVWATASRTEFVLDSPSRTSLSAGAGFRFKTLAELTMEVSRQRYAAGPADSY